MRWMGVCAWVMVQCAHAQHLDVEPSDLLDVIPYIGLVSEETDVLLRVRVLDPEGNLLVGRHSPDGSTFETDGTGRQGRVLSLCGWGQNRGAVRKGANRFMLTGVGPTGRPYAGRDLYL